MGSTGRVGHRLQRRLGLPRAPTLGRRLAGEPAAKGLNPAYGRTSVRSAGESGLPCGTPTVARHAWWRLAVPAGRRPE